jgi:membrane-associated protein
MHLDDHLMGFVQANGTWTYLLLFGIIFAETGLVVTPFLPGDSLLFAAGAVCARPDAGLSLPLMIAILIAAAILGDTVNYAVGKFFGHKLFQNPDSRIFKKSHLDKTHAFFEKHGGKTIIIARFVPIVRTFAPFVAGMGSMQYGKFLLYNVVGGVVWVVSCTVAGYFFGGLRVVKDNFSLIVLAIIFISILPVLFEVWQHRRKTKVAAEQP